uniref:EF-hand domain-containing protein n=1 Tax=Macrostomum lignano TaxID=282301 RepID=A0A1I8FH32_9PLAT
SCQQISSQHCTPNVKWLDLRGNRLRALPTLDLARMLFLEYLLLEDNCISRLPIELGRVDFPQTLRLYLSEKGWHSGRLSESAQAEPAAAENRAAAAGGRAWSTQHGRAIRRPMPSPPPSSPLARLSRATPGSHFEGAAAKAVAEKAAAQQHPAAADTTQTAPLHRQAGAAESGSARWRLSAAGPLPAVESATVSSLSRVPRAAGAGDWFERCAPQAGALGMRGAGRPWPRRGGRPAAPTRDAEASSPSSARRRRADFRCGGGARAAAGRAAGRRPRATRTRESGRRHLAPARRIQTRCACRRIRSCHRRRRDEDGAGGVPGSPTEPRPEPLTPEEQVAVTCLDIEVTCYDMKAHRLDIEIHLERESTQPRKESPRRAMEMQRELALRRAQLETRTLALVKDGRQRRPVEDRKPPCIRCPGQSQMRLAREQRVEFKLMFDSFVKNEERTVLPEDLEMMMRKLGFHPSKMEIQGMIEEIDTDGSFELLAARKAHDDISSEDITDAFRVFRPGRQRVHLGQLRFATFLTQVGETYTDEEIDALLAYRREAGHGRKHQL